MADAEQSITSGTTIARHGWAALIKGASGRGKSDFALRAIMMPLMLPGEPTAAPFGLISDDQTVLERNGNTIEVRAPDTLRNLIEVRGVGIVDVVSVPCARLGLIVELSDGPIERLPDDPGVQEAVLGVLIDVIQVRPFEASAPIKVALALTRAARRMNE